MEIKHLKQYAVLQYSDLLEFECDSDAIRDMVERGYRIEDYVQAASAADARIKYAELNKEKKQNHNSEPKDPSGYLNVMSTIFLILSIISCLALFVTGANMEDNYYEKNAWLAKYLYISGASWFVIALLIHSACRCLIYTTKKQSSNS